MVRENEDKRNADRSGIPNAVPVSVAQAPLSSRSTAFLQGMQWWVKDNGAVLDLMIGDNMVGGLGNADEFERKADLTLGDLGELTGEDTLRIQIEKRKKASVEGARLEGGSE